MADRSITAADPPPWVAEVATERQIAKLAPVSLWRELVQRSTLKASSRHVGYVLSFHAHDARTDEMTHDDLAARTGHNTRTIAAAVRELEASGWVLADRVSRRKAVRYVLTWPVESGNPAGTESGNREGTESGNSAGTPSESGNRDGTESGPNCSGVRESGRDYMWRCADDVLSSSVGGDSKTEPASSSDDDDGLSSDLVEAVVTLKVAGVTMLNPGRYRATVAANVPVEHGDDLRRVLAEHPAWPTNWIAAHALGLERTDPTPSEVIDACTDCTNGLVDTGAGMAVCPTCAWARAS